MQSENEYLYSPQNLKKARKKAGYTQEKAAEQIDLSVDMIRAYEQGRIDPPLARLKDLGRLYGAVFKV